MSDERAWDARYAESDRLWSGEPNVVLAREVRDLPPGRALDLGCGEGGDAIWLAARGRRVTAVDVSGGLLLIEGHMDTGPVARAEHEHAPDLPGPDEVIASLQLGEGWEVLLADVHDREQTIGGEVHHRSDNTVKLRRAGVDGA